MYVHRVMCLCIIIPYILREGIEAVKGCVDDMKLKLQETRTRVVRDMIVSYTFLLLHNLIESRNNY